MSARWPWVAVFAVTCAALIFVLAGLPARAVRMEETIGSSLGRRTTTFVTGAVHVHTTLSDGAASIDEVASAAARADLQFVVITDHGDGTRPPGPPSYRSGVLVIDAVEISAYGGHYVAVDLPQAPYPIAGEARDVVEDVRRLGGFGITAHGTSPKSDLAWHDWTLPIDAIEWLNLDTEWRTRTAAQIARAFLGYFLRPPEALGSLLARPAELLNRWDEISRSRRVVSIAATDCHTSTLPSYEACFRAITTRVELVSALSGRADADGRALVAALRAGHHYSSVDALAVGARFDFTATQTGRVAHEGDLLPAGAPVAFEARVDAPPGAELILLKNGSAVAESRASRLTFTAGDDPAAYRIEARLPAGRSSQSVPWIVSNPIYVGIPAAAVENAPQPAGSGRALHAFWAVERDDASRANVDRDPATVGGEGFLLRYALGQGPPADQFVAMVAPVDGLAAYGALTVTARASRPMRVGVQLRPAGRDNPPRWQRSVYLDRSTRTVTVRFDDMHPVPRSVSGPAPLPTIGAILFVIDTNNTSPGSSGEITVRDVTLGKSDDQRRDL